MLGSGAAAVGAMFMERVGSAREPTDFALDHAGREMVRLHSRGHLARAWTLALAASHLRLLAEHQHVADVHRHLRGVDRMDSERSDDPRPAAVVFVAILAVGIAAVVLFSTRPRELLNQLDGAGVAFTCLGAPAMTSWLTWRRLNRYLPFVPGPAKRVLVGAAGTFIMLGVYAFMFVLSAVKR